MALKDLIVHERTVKVKGQTVRLHKPRDGWETTAGLFRAMEAGDLASVTLAWGAALRACCDEEMTDQEAAEVFLASGGITGDLCKALAEVCGMGALSNTLSEVDKVPLE